MKSFKSFLEHSHCSTEVIETNGLWANIHAKRKRGERPAKPGDKDYPSKEAIKSAQEEVELDEVSDDLKKRYIEKGGEDVYNRFTGRGKYEKPRDPSKFTKSGRPTKSALNSPESIKYREKLANRSDIINKVSQQVHGKNRFEEVELDEAESWEAGYSRRVVKTTSAEHKEKGYNWRIKGKERPEISIKLYREKPSQEEFNKQMKRVAGHEFGG
jgi:hypothetical protein